MCSELQVLSLYTPFTIKTACDRDPTFPDCPDATQRFFQSLIKKGKPPPVCLVPAPLDQGSKRARLALHQKVSSHTDSEREKRPIGLWNDGPELSDWRQKEESEW